MSALELMLAGWGVLAALMAVLWLAQFLTRNAGIVDVAWAFGTGILGVCFALAESESNAARAVIVAVLAGVWGARLGVYLASRVFKESEDGRYKHLRSVLGGWTQPVMFIFFQIQALWGVLFALPMWAAAQSTSESLAWSDWLGVTIWLVAMLGETEADRQLNRFRRNPANRGQVCRSGFWRYSRHPNYFFEWLHWWAYVFIGLSSPLWWITIAGVALMYVFLTRVTGIPYTEQQAIRSRGDAYRRYQESTNVFFPFPPSDSNEEKST